MISLTPRQQKTALDLFTGAVVISVAVALAGLTWRIAGHAGMGAITVPSGTRAPAVAADIAPAIALAPFGKAPVSEATQVTGLPLELKGVVAAQPASLSVAFISEGGTPPKPFKIGDGVSGATIEGILRDRVVLNNGGRMEFLPFPDPTLSPEQRAQPAAPAATTAPAPTAQPPSTTGAPPPPAPAPAAAPQGIGNILQRFDATPAQGGYRVGNNAPPGTQPGDVLLSLNGTALSDTQAATAAATAAQQSGSASLVVMRDGKRMTLTVPLR